MRNEPARNKIYTLPHSITTASSWMSQMFETFVINVIINFRWKKGKQRLPRNLKRSISHSLDWKWSSEWREFWEGLLLATDVSATCAEGIFRVKWTLKMRMREVLTLRWLLHRLSIVSRQQQSFSRPQSPRWTFQSRYVILRLFLFYLTLRLL